MVRLMDWVHFTQSEKKKLSLYSSHVANAAHSMQRLTRILAHASVWLRLTKVSTGGRERETEKSKL